MDKFQVKLVLEKGGSPVIYEKDGSFEGGFSAEEADFGLKLTVREKDGLKYYKADFTPKTDVTLKAFHVTVPRQYSQDERIFCNGYQSWTDTKEFFPNEKLRGISKWLKVFWPANSCAVYGDYTWRDYDGVAGHLHSYDYTYINKNQGSIDFLGSLNERTGYTCFMHRVPESVLIIDKDVDGVEVKAGKKYALLELVEFSGGYDAVFDKYFELLKIEKPRRKFASGFTSWYNYYTDINRDIIIENVDNIAAGGYGLEIFQIDDGHQSAIGDWLTSDPKKFPDGMKPMAEHIKSKGMTPGIWLAPFACVPSSKVYQEHPDWLVKNADGTPQSAGNNWGGFFTLDFYNKDAAAYIKNFFDVILNDWGFEMVKLDFLYQCCITPRAGKSRGEVMDDAMKFIRECVGEKLVLGCGVPLFPAFGKVDFCRIGCDVHHIRWFETMFFGKWTHREDVRTYQAVTTSVYRRHMDGRAFVNDPDVFHLRNDNMGLSPEEKSVLARINHMFGNLLFTSDNVGKYDAIQSQQLKIMSKPSDTVIKNVWNEKPYVVTVDYTQNGEDKQMTVDLKKGRFIKE